eukprot:1104440-Rhodomonas_salina.1
MGEGGGGKAFTGLPQLASDTMDANPAADGQLGPAAGHWGGNDCEGCTLCPECCASGWIPGCGGYKEELGGKWGRGATVGDDLQSRYAFDQSEVRGPCCCRCVWWCAFDHSQRGVRLDCWVVILLQGTCHLVRSARQSSAVLHGPLRGASVYPPGPNIEQSPARFTPPISIGASTGSTSRYPFDPPMVLYCSISRNGFGAAEHQLRANAFVAQCVHGLSLFACAVAVVRGPRSAKAASDLAGTRRWNNR